MISFMIYKHLAQGLGSYTPDKFPFIFSRCIRNENGEAAMRNMAAIQMEALHFSLKNPITLERPTGKYCFKHDLRKKSRYKYLFIAINYYH